MILYKEDKTENLDACIKCSECTATCPVAAVNPLYPGPKVMGPDAERFRLEGIEVGTALLNHCSGCKTCEVTCPSGLKITEMILKAQENAIIYGTNEDNQTLKFKLRNLLLGRAEYLGKLATILPGLTNVTIRSPLVRKILEQLLGISAKASLPSYSPRFKGTPKKHTKDKKQVVYFPGCYIKYNDALTGRAIVKVLEHNGYEVIVPSFHCCGAPLKGNSNFTGAKENQQKNLSLMTPFMQADIPIITGCTTCSLVLKEYENLEKLVPKHHELQIYDFFEFLWELHEQNKLQINFKEVQAALGYHTACHLRAQGIGTPAVRLLRLIPGVNVVDLDQGCCGLSGSYGFKKEKYNVAMQIGNPLFTRVRQGIDSGEFQTITTECGGCQVQIGHGSKTKTEHPIWMFMQAYGLELNQ